MARCRGVLIDRLAVTEGYSDWVDDADLTNSSLCMQKWYTTTSGLIEGI